MAEFPPFDEADPLVSAFSVWSTNITASTEYQPDQMQLLSKVGTWPEDPAADPAFSNIGSWPLESIKSAFSPAHVPEIFRDIGSDNADNGRTVLSATGIDLVEYNSFEDEMFPGLGPLTEASTQDDVATLNTPFDGVFSDNGSEPAFPPFDPSMPNNPSLGYQQPASEHHRPGSRYSHASVRFVETLGRTDEEHHFAYNNSASNVATLGSYISPTDDGCDWNALKAFSDSLSDMGTYELSGMNAFVVSPQDTVACQHQNSGWETLSSSSHSSPTLSFPDDSFHAKKAVKDSLWGPDYQNRPTIGECYESDSYISQQPKPKRHRTNFNDSFVQRSTSAKQLTLAIPVHNYARGNMSPRSPHSAHSARSAHSEASLFPYSTSNQPSPHHSRDASPSHGSSTIKNNEGYRAGPSSGKQEPKSTKTPYHCLCGSVLRSGRNRDIDRHRSKCKANPNAKQIKCPICEHTFQFGRPDRLRKHMDKDHPGHDTN
ncbi:hypothetical protein BJ508DRAFT_321720 [Ascobolus immersus RN42]|uniref:Uncharacterized protein n=1 Tax=Ascobolus immersus RN42 TaxID=1160509 RepID=A0A3N4IKC2_ASCIM|nr:hypothetical protein BJ508DRAFT_321720 [Ascobolus immersus RN42]